MLKGFLEKFRAWRDADRADRESAEGRRLGAERLEDRQADEFVEEHLGGINPNRLLGADERPRDV